MDNKVIEFVPLHQSEGKKIDFNAKAIDPNAANIDIERADRHDAILLGLIEDNRSEFDKRRDAIEYEKNRQRLEDLCDSILKTLDLD